VLTLGIGLTGLLYREGLREADARVAARILRAAARIQSALLARSEAAENVLRAAAGFFVGSEAVKEAEFRSFYEELDSAKRDSSMRTMAFIVPVRREDLSDYLARRRAEGPELKNVTTSGDRDELFLIQFAEPRRPGSMALGLDTGAVPANRAALEESRDLGLMRVGGPISLPDPALGPGLVFQYPVYAKGAPRTSVAERRHALKGWVSILFVVRPLMADVLREEDPDLKVELDDAETPGAASLLYSSAGAAGPGPVPRTTIPLILGAHHLTLVFTPGPGWAASDGAVFSANGGKGARSWLLSRPVAILGGGLLVSGLLFGIVWSLAATRHQALAAAREMTASLRASEQRYERLFEQSLAGIYRTTPEGRILECNEAFARLFGYESRRDLLESSAVALYESPESRQRFLEALREKGTLVAYESRSRRKDGTLFWSLEHASLLPGPPEIIEGTIVDISERKEAEEALRLSRERYRGVIESSRDGLLFFDLATRRVLESNPAFQRMLGYTAEELSGLTLYDFAPDDRASVDANVHRLVDQGALTIKNRAFRRKDGKEAPVEVDAVLVEEGGRRTVLNVVHSLADRRALEEQLRQAQKMEAVGRLAGGVAHDFNNLLTAVLGYAELLLDSDPSPEVKHSADEIRKAGDRAAVLTKQLLAFSRKQVLQPKVLDLNEVLAEIDGLLRRTLGEDVTYEAERDPHLWRILADPGQLHQVLLNLAVNSRDAMPEGGILRIATRNVSLNAANLPEVPKVAEGDYVLLEVADTGHGMDAETLSHAFEPFFTTKERGKGTGLGLSTVYGIVKQSGGYIHIESEPGNGTRVLIYLTRVHGAADSPSNVSPRSLPRGGTETILLVEDEESVRRLASLLLERSGYHLLVASSAEEALETARGYAGPIDLLLTDVVLPGLNGRRLADLLAPERPSMKVVFASGYFDERGILEPGSDFIQKPFNPETLARSVRRALDRKGPPPA
jgi:PAS domain S-box-containing protein